MESHLLWVFKTRFVRSRFVSMSYIYIDTDIDIDIDIE